MSRFRNINLDAAKIHIISDILLSIGVLISAGIIYVFAPHHHWSLWQLADPFCTYLFSIMAIYTTIPITKDAILLLLDGLEKPEVLQSIETQFKNDPVIVEVKELKVWSINRDKMCGGLKVVVGQGDISSVKNVFTSRGIAGFV